MKVTFAPKGVLQIDDCRIIFRNFSGRADKYNHEGDRNFSLVIPDDETAQQLLDAGWNVKTKPPRVDGEEPLRTLPIKIKFNEHGPAVYLQTGGSRNRLDEETVGMLDNIDIQSVDLDVRPYHWEVNGKTGTTAYLQSMLVTQRVDRFAETAE